MSTKNVILGGPENAGSTSLKIIRNRRNLHRNYDVKLSSSLIEKFPLIVKSVDNSILRTNSGFKLIYLLKILYPLSQQPLRSSKLLCESMIGYKKTFFTYCKLCLNLGFVEKKTVGSQTWYSLTQKGRVCIGLFEGGFVE